MKKVITGNSSAAYGAKISRAEVIAAYPITPQTSVVEKIAEFVSSGEMKAKYIKVESEHSAMAACIAASNTGARTFTATSSHGLLLMHEMLHWASAARLPIVMVNVNRALGPPWSVWADHTDSFAQRDTGWMQFYCMNNQEVLDTVIQCYKLGEQNDILLPSMISLDAFYLSHTVEPVEIPEQELVDEFLPPFDPPYKLDVNNPYGFGSLSMPTDWYMELRYLIAEAHEKALERVEKVNKEFANSFGRSYDFIDCYKCDDAEVVLLSVGTVASTAREVVDKLRNEGEKVGFARLRIFRPFPVNALRELGRRVKFLGVMDRCFTFGYEGPLFTEIKGALYKLGKKPLIKNYIIGIGGRDITMVHVEKLYRDAYTVIEKGLGLEVEWIDLKGEQEIHRRS